MRAIGLRPNSRAFFSVPMTSAAAPSLMPEELPAVTVPSFAKAGFNALSFSAVVPARGYSSRLTLTEAPFVWGTSTATISRSNLPALMASPARRWLSAEKAS
jgi:hypothetical protein